ncbi:hypothetical protein ACVFYP_21965 [Roseomonas sp. F4]
MGRFLMQFPLSEPLRPGAIHRFRVRFPDRAVQTIDYVEGDTIHLHLKLAPANGTLTANDLTHGRWNEEVVLPLPELGRGEPVVLEVHAARGGIELRAGQAKVVLTNRRGLVSEATLLRCSGGVSFSAEATSRVDPALEPGPNCLGSIDRCTDQLVRGWAADPDLPDQPLLVDILVDGEHRGSVIADVWRQELQALRPDLASHGFIFRFPSPISRQDGREHKVSAVIHGRNLELAHSPWFVSRATPENPPRLVPTRKPPERKDAVLATKLPPSPQPDAHLAGLQETNRVLSERLSQVEEVRGKLQAELETQQASLNTRYNELAILTRLLEENRLLLEAAQRTNGGSSKPKEGDGSKPKGGGESKPKDGDGSKPKGGGESKPKEGDGSKPKGGGESKPKEGDGSKPKGGGEPKPKEGGGSKPKASGEAKPKEADGAKPKGGGESKPKDGEGPKPKASGESKPKEGDGSKPKASGEAKPKEADSAKPKSGGESKPKEANAPKSKSGNHVTDRKEAGGSNAQAAPPN